MKISTIDVRDNVVWVKIPSDLLKDETAKQQVKIMCQAFQGCGAYSCIVTGEDTVDISVLDDEALKNAGLKKIEEK
jgi:hypothetical protein